ncbi:class I SAM-dependent methyltransferase [Paralcaligenes sp. KSB-10]|uniref:class I SAM-dependent methyltransferase n=1 Tax=Paralcaligenes sp. KSB-10 TaxID=2901142 RepID=UPI001E415EBC|nr:class I SAM-dependent methyltransferase [Paralcaligenes sp. KSB-10]UHL65593.1 class I SAM-dependent methyltransferase [Paralcaligenes sp. KSB-10]
MTQHSDRIRQISAPTLAYYNQNAEEFREGTRNHDVAQNIAALLRHIEARPPFRILDFGCGPGRDLHAFARLGHVPIGLDGTESFAVMARAETGCEVWQQDFLNLDLPRDHFDGVFANASLFHVPGVELPRVLTQLCAALKPGGVLFSSNPRGQGEEGWHGGRYGVYHDLDSWRAFMVAAGFIELEHYYRPAGLPREQQSWLASVWRKPASFAKGGLSAGLNNDGD